jgi:hypothetical protein
MNTSTGNDFERAAAAPTESILAEFWEFFRHNKKWWLVPIMILLVLFGVLLLLSGTAAAPFIYTLF